VTARRYQAYSLQIQSEVPLPGFVEGDGDPDVVISLGEVEADGAPSRSPRFLGTLDEGRLIWDGVGAALIRFGREIVAAHGDDERRLGGFLAGPALGVLLIQRGFVALHASAVEIGGGAVAFAGAARAGKSTLSTALHARGHRLVADDIVAVRLEDGQATVVPGAPVVKLWPEAVRELGDDPGRLERVRNDLDKRIRPVPDGFSPDPVPLRLVYLLESGDPHGVEDVRPADAVIELLLHSWTPRSLHASEPSERLERYARLVASVPVRRLRRPDALSSVRELAALVEHDAGGGA
jgi:hypothetical protein